MSLISSDISYLQHDFAINGHATGIQILLEVPTYQYIYIYIYHIYIYIIYIYIYTYTYHLLEVPTIYAYIRYGDTMASPGDTISGWTLDQSTECLDFRTKKHVFF